MTVSRENLESFGFYLMRGGAHTSRTMMLGELTDLLDRIPKEDARPEEYRYAIETENCLNKRSHTTRSLTYKHLVELYALNPNVPIFRALRYFWERDSDGRPLLALLCAYARDPILRIATPLVINRREGERVSREALENYIAEREPERFSQATLKSTAQNINASFTQSGHLRGGRLKVRASAEPSAGSGAYALLLGYLRGGRGTLLLESEFTQLLDCTSARLMDLASDASRRGWMNLRSIGDVMEVTFPNLLSKEVMELTRG